ncbi:MAG: nuclear transport factor 2 family protein [Bdellovibrionota bacterium]
MQNILYTLLFFAAIPALADKAPPAITKTLDAWHAAAAKGSEELYFSYLSPDAVFLGTDPKERWTKDEFRKWAHPIFAKGKAWEIKSLNRHIFLSADKKTAWFDEEAESRELGSVRGSGVLVLEKGKWKVSQYNLSVPIPNDKFEEARKLIEQKPKKE